MNKAKTKLDEMDENCQTQLHHIWNTKSVHFQALIGLSSATSNTIFGSTRQDVDAESRRKTSNRIDIGIEIQTKLVFLLSRRTRVSFVDRFRSEKKSRHGGYDVLEIDVSLSK